MIPEHSPSVKVTFFISYWRYHNHSKSQDTWGTHLTFPTNFGRPPAHLQRTADLLLLIGLSSQTLDQTQFPPPQFHRPTRKVRDILITGEKDVRKDLPHHPWDFLANFFFVKGLILTAVEGERRVPHWLWMANTSNTLKDSCGLSPYTRDKVENISHLIPLS